MTPKKVPIGPTTVIGYGASATALVAAALAYVFKDADQQLLGVIAAGLVGLVTLVTTQLGRYAQATAAARKPAVATTPLIRNVHGDPGPSVKPPSTSDVAGWEEVASNKTTVGLEHTGQVSDGAGYDPAPERGSLAALVGDDPALDDPEHQAVGEDGPARLEDHTGLDG